MSEPSCPSNAKSYNNIAETFSRRVKGVEKELLQPWVQYHIVQLLKIKGKAGTGAKKEQTRSLTPKTDAVPGLLGALTNKQSSYFSLRMMQGIKCIAECQIKEPKSMVRSFVDSSNASIGPDQINTLARDFAYGVMGTALRDSSPERMAQLKASLPCLDCRSFLMEYCPTCMDNLSTQKQ